MRVPYILLFFLIIGASPLPAIAQAEDPHASPVQEPLTDLNLRFSNRPLIPPDHLIAQTIPMEGITVATPFVAPSPQAVIFENNQRQRLAILSTVDAGELTLYLLEPLPLDPMIPSLVQCANDRGCQTDRTPLTGGLGCLALCLKEILETVADNPLPR